MHQVNTVGKLRLALGNLDTLPAMPEIARKLLALRLDTEAGEAQMLRLIEQDPPLSARIFGLSNTPAIASGRSICSVHDAAMLLGLKRLKSVAIGIAALSGLPGQTTEKYFNPHDFWSHSITVAIAMEMLAQSMPGEIRPDGDQAFLAGLLHDIGIMALHHIDHIACDALHHQLRLQPKRAIYEIEMELLGMTHGQIGALLAQHWNLPAEVIAVIERHHMSRMENSASANLLVRMANIVERLLQDSGIAKHSGKLIDDSEWRELRIDPAREDDIFSMVSELAIQVAQSPTGLEATQHSESHPATPSESDFTMTQAHIIFAPLKALLTWGRKILRQ